MMENTEHTLESGSTTQPLLDIQAERPGGFLRRRNPSNLSSINRYLIGGSAVESDGVIYQRERDAPGQNCLYVPPGDHNTERYRLATFAQYPSDVPVKVTDMAAAGFYFTGYKDRVKCFSCGIAVENWMAGDDAMDKKWHKSDCKMALGNENKNNPIATPNFRSIFRLASDAASGRTGYVVQDKNMQERMGTVSFGNQAGAPSRPLPNDITDVTTDFRRVQLSDSFPDLVFANILSTEHENLLQSLNLKREADRRRTYLKWPSYPAPYLPSDLAKQGFFYLGNLDRTQCFSCSGVLRNWAPYDSVREQHEKHFPNCRIVRQMDSGNIPLTDDERKDADEAERLRVAALLPSSDSLVEPADPSQEEQRHLAVYFPCRDAVNQHMSRVQKRIETFTQGWPRDRIRATPEAIAKAGFFYLGESDKTKCFYCNGGLQNWDPNDEPWTEHAKWFPGCEFVLRRKGVDFVRSIAEAHPNLNRPYIRNPVSMDIPPRDVDRTSPPQSMETQSTNVDVTALENMGFSKQQIERAIQRKNGQGGYNTTQELLDDLLEQGDSEAVNGVDDLRPQSIGVEENAASGPPAVLAQAGLKREAATGISETVSKKTRTASPVSKSAEDEKLQQSLKELEKTGLCRVCKSSPAETVLIPCGHLAACGNCVTAIKRCPICDVKVSSTVKVFRV